jgi:glycosyltransferase involved in cell wall biosynthesis
MSSVSVVPVSVVMPSFNQARFIQAAADSVLKQSFDDLELVVVDGGSTDGTQLVLERLSAQHRGRLRWMSEADRGPAEAVNKGFRMARGGVVGWLNSDDLYAPGAVDRALAHFNRHPEHVMVYGQGTHVDEGGQDAGAYPTLRPDQGRSIFREGCSICQPTVFLRREVFDAVGVLDESLHTAFDFDFWLRVFDRFSGRIGFVDAVQAHTRLHGACITLRLRRQVFVESMRILARSFGAAPRHWVNTYLNEMLATYPFGPAPEDARSAFSEFAADVSPLLGADDRQALVDMLRTDLRLARLHRDACVDVYGDGWVAPECGLRVRVDKTPWRCVQMVLRNQLPGGQAQAVTVESPLGEARVWELPYGESVTLVIDLPPVTRAPAYVSYRLRFENHFRPTDVYPDNKDSRQLACVLEGVDMGESPRG